MGDLQVITNKNILVIDNSCGQTIKLIIYECLFANSSNIKQNFSHHKFDVSVFTEARLIFDIHEHSGRSKVDLNREPKNRKDNTR